jgi:hypothetical protein
MNLYPYRQVPQVSCQTKTLSRNQVGDVWVRGRCDYRATLTKFVPHPSQEKEKGGGGIQLQVQIQ